MESLSNFCKYCVGTGPDTTEKGKYTELGKSFSSYLNPFTSHNAGILLSYQLVGISLYFLSTPISVYMIDTLNVSSTQYSAFSTLVSLPWSLKFLFGMLSDGVPIMGYRRKSWLIIGWIINSLTGFALGYMDDPSFASIAIFMFIGTSAYLLSDVCTDTMAVERSKCEPPVRRGSFQTSCYTIRSFGCIIGALMGTLLYNTASWGWGLSMSQLFLLSALLPVLFFLPSFWPLEEQASKHALPDFSEQISSIWQLLQEKVVWTPITFIFTYNLMQIPNSAWTNFLVVGLDFTDFELGVITIAQAVLFWVGMIVYKKWFFTTSWRWIYIYTGAIGALFSLGQIVLVKQWNTQIGIPDLWFALGDSAISTLVAAIQYMPMCILFSMICPEGNEGLTYALLTTLSNLAGSIASDIGSALTLIWNVDNTTLESGDYSGILYLTILTSCLQLAPLLLVWILPDSKAEQLKMIAEGGKSERAGTVLATVIIVSLIVVFASSIYMTFF